MALWVIQEVLDCTAKTIDVSNVHQQPCAPRFHHLGQCTRTTGYDGHAHGLTLHDNDGPAVEPRTDDQHIATHQVLFGGDKTQEVHVFQDPRSDIGANDFLDRSTTGDNEFDVRTSNSLSPVVDLSDR